MTRSEKINDIKQAEDDLFNEAVGIIIQINYASIPILQRRLRISYAQASSILDELEANGFVSSHDGSKPRKVLITQEQYKKIFL